MYGLRSIFIAISIGIIIGVIFGGLKYISQESAISKADRVCTDISK